MTDAADRSQHPPPSPVAEPGFSAPVRDELAKLHGKQIGACAVCGRAVFFEQNFTRFRGRVVHVRCPISAQTAAAIAARHP
jgi:hypothetical protein